MCVCYTLKWIFSRIFHFTNSLSNLKSDPYLGCRVLRKAHDDPSPLWNPLLFDCGWNVSCEWVQGWLSEWTEWHCLSPFKAQSFSGVIRRGSQRYSRRGACSTIVGVEEGGRLVASTRTEWPQLTGPLPMGTRNRTLPTTLVSLDGDSFPNALFLLWDTPSREPAETSPIFGHVSNKVWF